jgi:hypothetical protein
MISANQRTAYTRRSNGQAFKPGKQRVEIQKQELGIKGKIKKS